MSGSHDHESAEAIREDDIGEVIAAAVSGEIIVKLRGLSEGLRVGYPVVTEGLHYNFFSIVGDVETPHDDTVTLFANADKYRGATDMIPLADRETLTRGRGFFSIAKLNCVKMIDRNTKKILEFETVPGHFSPTRFANLDDIKLVYKDGEHSRSVGTLRGLPEFPIPIDLQTLTSVPFGIFGRTHSGKTFLNKILLGNILHSQVSQVFVFDTQSEYGWRSRADNSPGLKTFFSSKVKLLALDKQTTPQ